MSTSPATNGTGHEVFSHAARGERKKEIADRVGSHAFYDRLAAMAEMARLYKVEIKTVQTACRIHNVTYPGQRATTVAPKAKRRTPRAKPRPQRAAGARA